MTYLTAGHITTFFEKWAPESNKLDYDNIGLLTGSKTKIIHSVLTCLDVTNDVVEEAISLNCDMIIAHHPVIFDKLSRINPDNFLGNLLYKIISQDIAVLAVHTNLDAAINGVSFVMAQQIGLKNTRFLVEGDSDLEPHGFGVIGEYEDSLSKSNFLEAIKSKLKCESIRYSGSKETITKVAVCGGSGSSLASKAIEMQADAYITADIKYHDFFLDKPDFMLLDVGHYESESPVIDVMRDTLKKEFTELTVESTSVNTNPIQTYK
ncbi:MAG: Nif3-like dinuclear metal center hexameric protein [Balneolales bacterium]